MWDNGALNQSLGSLLGQLNAGQNLALYQQQQFNYQNCQSSALQQMLANSMMNAAPTETPEQRAAWRRSRAETWASEGRDVLDRLVFWRGIPVLGWIVSRKLAKRLDWITEQIEGYVSV